jgi:hypothetical protein
VDVDPLGELLHREQPVTMSTGGAVDAALADVGAEAICRTPGGRVVDGEDITLMWCAPTCLRPGTSTTISPSVVVAAAVVDMGTNSRVLALRQNVEQLEGVMLVMISFASQATGSMLVMVTTCTVSKSMTMESLNAVVAAAGEGAAAVAEACGAEGANTEGKMSSFFILPSSESNCASSESNCLEIVGVLNRQPTTGSTRSR